MAWADRPLTTENAGVIPGGKGQLEMSWDYAAEFGESRNHIFLAVPGFGIADRVEFTVELPFVLGQEEGQGWTESVGDVKFTSKVLVYPESRRVPGVAVQVYYKLNSGSESDGAGTGDRETGFFFILSKEIGDFAFHGMMGLDINASGADRGQGDVAYGVAVDYTAGKPGGRPLHLVTEIFGGTDNDPAISFGPAVWLIGAAYELSEAWVLDAGIAVGLTRNGTNLNTTMGVTFQFP